MRQSGIAGTTAAWRVQMTFCSVCFSTSGRIGHYELPVHVQTIRIKDRDVSVCDRCLQEEAQKARMN